MDIRDWGTFFVLLAMSPLFLAVLAASLLITSPVWVPLYLLDRWTTRD